MNGIEKKLRENNLKYSYVIEITDHDENAKYLIGWPGYRTSKNKSGLGYLETQTELAHMQGVMLRQMFTGKFITHNLFFLFCMLAFGLLVGIFPLIILLVEIFSAGNLSFLFAIFPVSPYMLVGIALVINSIISIVNPGAESITGD